MLLFRLLLTTNGTFARRGLGFRQKCRERQNGESVAVVGVGQIEHSRETGAGGVVFVPSAIGTLRFDQIFRALVQADAATITAREQAENGPCRLGGRAGPGVKVSLS